MTCSLVMPGSIDAACARASPVKAAASNAMNANLRMISLPSGVSGDEQRFEQDEPIPGAEQRIHGPLGVWHQANHVARGVADARDVSHCAIRICIDGRLAGGIHVLEDHLAVALELIENVLAG